MQTVHTYKDFVVDCVCVLEGGAGQCQRRVRVKGGERQGKSGTRALWSGPASARDRMEVYSVMVTSTLSWLAAARPPEQQRPKQDLVNTNICRQPTRTM